MTLCGSIVEMALATPELAPLAVGGVWHGMAPRMCAAPYIRINLLYGADTHNSGTVYYRTSTILVSIFAKTWGEVERLAAIWVETFNHHMAPLNFAEGNHGTVHCGELRDNGTFDNSLTTTGTKLCHGILMMRVITEHHLSA